MSFFANTAAQNQVQKKLANISDDAINSNQQAVPVNYLAGRAYVTGAYISPAYNPIAQPITTQTGKSDSETTGYKYFASFALMFCLGGRHPVDAVYSVIVDSDIAWSGNIQRGNAEKVVITVPSYGVIHLYWGSETQQIDNILLTPRSVPIGGGNPQDNTSFPANTGPNPYNGLAAGDPNPYSGHYDQHPAYRGQCYGVFVNWKLGRDRTSVPNIALELKRGCPWVNGGQIAADDLGVNPAPILYDWLTDARFGMALPDSQINVQSFINLYNSLETDGARLAPVITQQTDFRQIVAQLLEYYDGWIRRSGWNGAQIEVGRWSHGTIVSAGTLNDNDLLGDPELQPSGWGPTINEVTVVYADREHHYNEYIQTWRDPNNFRITGEPRPVTLQRSWLTDATLAKRYAREYGAIQALPTMQGQLHVKREWLTNNNILPGVVFFWQSSFYGLQFYMRVLEIEHEADDSAKATLTVQWESAIWPSLYIPPPFQGPPPIVFGPRDVWFARMAEIPYLFQDHRFVTQLVTLAVKGNADVVGYRVWASFDGGNTYDVLVSSNNFCAFGRTVNVIGPGASSAYIDLYGVGLDAIVSQTEAQQNDDTLLAFIDAEVMSIGLVTPVGNGRVLIDRWLRARFGTTAQTHVATSTVCFIRRDHLHIMDHARFVPGVTVFFKLQSFTLDDEQDLASSPGGAYLVIGFNPLEPPILTPPGGSFSGSKSVIASAQGGLAMRYTTDGSEVLADNAIWPAGGITLTGTTTVRIRAFAADGRYSAERIAVFTKVASAAQVPDQCSPPSGSFSGIQQQTAGNLTLTATTTGSTLHYRKNAGATVTYSTPVALQCNAGGDYIEFWATKPGLDESNHAFFNNILRATGGGGTGGGGPGPQP